MARRSRDQFSPKIRNLRWGGNSHVFAALAAGDSAQVMITAADTNDTIMRIRGELLCYVDGFLTPGRLAKIGIGAIVMPEGQGTTVVSGPLADDSAPWLFYESFLVGYEEYVTDVVDNPGLTIFRKTIDVKAMRILRPDRELQIVAENATIGTAVAVNLSLTFRALIGQH